MVTIVTVAMVKMVMAMVMVRCIPVGISRVLEDM